MQPLFSSRSPSPSPSPSTISVIASDAFNAITYNKCIIYGCGIGDRDGTANECRFHLPQGLTVDHDTGDIFVADTFNHKIKKIDANGMVTTFAGTGSRGSTSAGRFNSQFQCPWSVIIDTSKGIKNRTIYVGDNTTVRKIVGDDVVTLGGRNDYGFADGLLEQAHFKSVTGLAVDKQGDIILADCDNNRIRKIHDGTVETIAGDGSKGSTNRHALTSSFNCPWGVVIEEQSNKDDTSPSSYSILVSDSGSKQIRKIHKDGTVTTLAELPTPCSPHQLVLDHENNLIVADSSGKIRKIDKSGTITTLKVKYQFHFASGLAIRKNGNIIVSDRNRNQIIELISDYNIAMNWPSSHSWIPPKVQERIQELLLYLIRRGAVPRELRLLIIKQLIILEIV